MRTLRKAFDWFPILGAVQYFFCSARIRDRHYDAFPDRWFYYHLTFMIAAAAVILLITLLLYFRLLNISI